MKIRATQKDQLEKRILNFSTFLNISGCCTTPASKSVERRLARVYVFVSWMSTIDSGESP